MPRNNVAGLYDYLQDSEFVRLYSKHIEKILYGIQSAYKTLGIQHYQVISALNFFSDKNKEITLNFNYFEKLNDVIYNSINKKEIWNKIIENQFVVTDNLRFKDSLWRVPLTYIGVPTLSPETHFEDLGEEFYNLLKIGQKIAEAKININHNPLIKKIINETKAKTNEFQKSSIEHASLPEPFKTIDLGGREIKSTENKIRKQLENKYLKSTDQNFWNSETLTQHIEDILKDKGYQDDMTPNTKMIMMGNIISLYDPEELINPNDNSQMNKALSHVIIELGKSDKTGKIRA